MGTAKDGAEALEMIEKLRPDLVITDIQMPGFSGLEMIAKIRKRNIGCHFIILSGFDNFSYAQQAIEIGVDCYLLKPVTIEVLTQKITAVCAHIRDEYSSCEENAVLHTTAHIAEPVLRQRFYSLLAQGEYHSQQEIKHSAGNLAASLIECPYVAVVLRFTLNKQKNLTQFSRDELYLFRFAIRNIAAEIFDINHQVECFLDQGNTIGFLLCPQKNTVDFLQQWLDDLQKIAPEGYFTIGVSKQAFSLLEAPAVCRQAQEISEYHMYHAGTNIFTTEILSQTSGVPVRVYSSSFLVELILTNSKSEIEKELDKFFDEIMYISMPPPQYIRGMCGYLIKDIAKRLSNLVEYEDCFFDHDILNEIETVHYIDDLKSSLKKHLMIVSDNIQKIKKNQIPEIIEHAQEYIHKNIFSKLEVEDVSDEVHISKSYFTTLFKKYTGITVRDYILKAKMEKAKDALVRTDLSIFEIAESLEYSDYRSFSRAFKQVVGCTPSEYRQSFVQPNGDDK